MYNGKEPLWLTKHFAPYQLPLKCIK